MNEVVILLREESEGVRVIVTCAVMGAGASHQTGVLDGTLHVRVREEAEARVEKLLTFLAEAGLISPTWTWAKRRGPWGQS